MFYNSSVAASKLLGTNYPTSGMTILTFVSSVPLCTLLLGTNKPMSGMVNPVFVLNVTNFFQPFFTVNLTSYKSIIY